jgi:hypothetical protein
MALMMVSFMLFTAALILDSVARSRAEQLRIHYMSIKPMTLILDQSRSSRITGEQNVASRERKAGAA